MATVVNYTCKSFIKLTSGTVNWEFDVVLNPRQFEIPTKNKARSMTSLQYLLNLAPTLDNF